MIANIKPAYIAVTWSDSGECISIQHLPQDSKQMLSMLLQIAQNAYGEQVVTLYRAYKGEFEVVMNLV